MLPPTSPRDRAEFFNTDSPDPPLASPPKVKKSTLPLEGPLSSSSLSLSYPVRALKALWCFLEGRGSVTAVLKEVGVVEEAVVGLLGVGRLVKV